MTSTRTCKLESTTAPKQSHYDILQVSPTATTDEIKAAYRFLIIGCHPDKLPSVTKKDERRNHDSKVMTISEALSAIDIDDADAATDDNVNETEYKTSGNNRSKQLNCPDVPISEVINTKKEESANDATTFHQIQAAYHCLRDSDKRRLYDEIIIREVERKEWKLKGASEVKLSEMECEWCSVVVEGNSDNDKVVEEATILQKVFFYSCRCGDTFQVDMEELLGAIDDARSVTGIFTNRVWQCESCSLTIQIKVDIDINE